MQTNQPQSREQIEQLTKIIWGAFLSFQFILGFAAYNVVPLPESGITFDAIKSGFENHMALVFAFVAISSVFFGFYSGVLLNNAAFFVKFLVKIAAFEFCGFCGFIAATVTHNFPVMLPFLAASVLAMLMAYPKPEGNPL